MADTRGQGSKRPAPVEVHYFRKPARAGRARASLSGDAHPTLEMPAATADGAPPSEAPERSPRPAKAAESRKRASPPPAEPESAAERARAKLAGMVDPAKLGRLSEKQIAEIAIFGHHLFENGKLDEARVVFESLVGLGVKDAFPHTMLGTIYLAQGEPKLALALFEASLELDPNDLAARVYRGEIRMMEGRPAEAIEDLAGAVERGDDADPFVDRARKLLKAARGQVKKRRQKG